MMDWHHHGHGGFFLHGVIGLLALIGLVAVVLAVIRAFRGRSWHDRRRHGMGAGLEIVETRYARGEIGRDEYLEKKRDLASRV
jgi:putative membrane protein